MNFHLWLLRILVRNRWSGILLRFMKVRIENIIIVYFLLNLFLFDLQTKLLNIPFYANDILFLGLFIYYLRFKIKIPKRNFFLIISLIAIIIFQILKFHGPFFIRDLQFILRILTALLTSILILNNYVFTKEVIIIISKILLIIGYLAFCLLFLGIDILPYTSGRTFLGTRQFSSVFSEPALYGLTSFFFLHFIFPRFEKIQKHKSLFSGLILSIVLSQSLGAIFGLFIWFMHLLFKVGSKLKILQYVLIISIGMLLTFTTTLRYFPESRISRAFLFFTLNKKYCINNIKFRRTYYSLILDCLNPGDFESSKFYLTTTNWNCLNELEQDLVTKKYS